MNLKIVFMIGTFYLNQGGMYLLQILDNFVGGWTLLIIGFAENMAIAYCYGKTIVEVCNIL